MTPFQWVLIGFAAGVLFCGVIASAACGLWSWLVRERQRGLDEFHAHRDSVREPLRAPGKQFEISPRAERNKHNG